MTAEHPPHRPVMVETCLELLGFRDGDWVVDGTFGAGGHSRALLDRGACVLAIDRDPDAKGYAQPFAEGCFRLVEGNFRNLDDHVAAAGLDVVQGVLLDLGVSSMQLDEAERGFAFRHGGPLDMRMAKQGESAAEVVNSYSHEALAEIIYRYGEDHHSRRIARAIVAARQEEPITTTERLEAVVKSAYPAGQRRDHPSRRTFQALRIHVNDELGSLRDGLAAASLVLEPGGRLVVLSYHSLEDRLVKRHLRDDPSLVPLTKRPLGADEDEIQANPRARSAKLRAAEKVDLVNDTQETPSQTRPASRRSRRRP